MINLGRLARVRAIAIALKRGRSGLRASYRSLHEGSRIKQGFASARVQRVQNYGAVEQLGQHAKSLLVKHAALANKRGGSRLATSLTRQNQYVRHVQTTMRKTLKANKTTGPYGKTLIGQVKVAQQLVRRTH